MSPTAKTVQKTGGGFPSALYLSLQAGSLRSDSVKVAPKF